MKKYFFNKRMACGLAVALVATGTLSLLTPPLKPDNSGTFPLFSDNSNLSMTANASAVTIDLSEDDLVVADDSIKGFTSTGSSILINNAADEIILNFPDIPGVTKIGENAFNEHFTDKNVGIQLPNNITTIEENAFSDNPKLTSIKFGDNLQTIGKFAFRNDKALTSLDLGSTVRSMGYGAFADTGITGELIIPDSVTNMGESCFCDVKGLTKVTFPASLKIIPPYAFYQCDNLTSVTFSEGLESIAERAFQRCSISKNSEPFNLPDSLEELGYECFDMNNIKSVKLPDGIKLIDGYVFANNEITSANLGAYNNVKARAQNNPGTPISGAIPYGIFANTIPNRNNDQGIRNKLTSIEFPGFIHTIGAEAFKGNDFTSYEVPLNVTSINDGAFDENKSLSSITLHNDITVIGSGAFRNCAIPGTLNYLPTNLKTLGNEAFSGNQLTEVFLPDDLEYLGEGVFSDNQIKEVTRKTWGKYDKVTAFANGYDHYDEHEYKPFFKSDNGEAIPNKIFEKNPLEKIVMPENTVAIGKWAFGWSKNRHSDTKIEKVDIPAGVKYIGAHAFHDTKIKILNFLGKNVEIIGIIAFGACHIENDIEIFDNIKILGSSAFCNNDMKKVTFGNTDVQIGYSCFSGCDYLQDVENFDRSKFWAGTFDNSKIVNLTFDYANLNNTFTSTEALTFRDSLIRSVNIPAQIKVFPKGPADYTAYYGSQPEISAFYNELSWYPGSEESYKKVALYRVDKDGTTYVTDNELTDGDYHTFNPVLVSFKLVDQDGNKLPDSLLPESITGKRIRATDNSSVNFVATTSAISAKELVDYKNFKLADKVKFTLPSTPSGYDFVEVATLDGLTKVVGEDKTYELTLDPDKTDVVVETRYEDNNYKLGYKKTTITLKYNKKPGGTGGGTTTPTVPVIPGQPDVTPEQPSTDVVNPDIPQDNTNTDVDITDQNAPLGNTNIDTTDVDDDISPLGTKKISKKVKANKPNEVNVEDTKAPLGTLPRTGGSNDSGLMLLGATLLGLGMVVKKKIR